MFNIKLKTKSGNELSEKQNVTVMFEVRLINSMLKGNCKGLYSYKIIYPKGMLDNNSVFKMKEEIVLKSEADLTLKVIINLLHIIQKLSVKYNISPDKIMLISKSIGKTKIWKPLKDIFEKQTKDKLVTVGETVIKTTELVNTKALQGWSGGDCNRMGINRSDLALVQDFVNHNRNIDYITIDPSSDAQRYEKSLIICNGLDKKFHDFGTESEQLQITAA